METYLQDLKAGKIKKIKLLGDSITHGMGGTGYCMDGEPIAGNFFRNPNGYCWAKLFKEYIEGKYGVSVVNNGCSGTNSQFILQHFDTLVEKDDDLIFCMIGTNNRHQYKTAGEEKKSREEMGKLFYDSVLQMYDLFKAKNKRVIFMANIPASQANEQDGEEYWRILHMDDINAIYKAAQKEAGFPLISLYDMLTQYLEKRGETVDGYLRDGLHPNDKGYEVMFTLLIDKLAI